MDLNDIRVFAKVVEAGSFIGASRALGIPRSTVSRKVSELEGRLGARLLQRTTRSLSLTDVGQTYYEHAARIVSEVEEAELAVTRLQQTPRGLLRVTAPLSFGHLGPIVASFLSAFPEVQLELVCTDRVVDLVDAGFDVGIRAGRLADSTLIARRLGVMRSFVVASPAFVDEHGVPDAPPALEHLDCLVFGVGAAPSTWTLHRRGKAISVAARARLVANDLDYLEDAARAGLGIAMLPAHRCMADIREGKLRRLLPEWCSAEIPVHAVYPSARHLSPKLQSFLEHVRSSLG